MESKASVRAFLLIHCPDRKGLVAAVTDYLYRLNANILDLGQHVDWQDNRFFMRVMWDLHGFKLTEDEFRQDFQARIASKFEMVWRLHYDQHPMRVAIFVSKMSHCLHDMLQRYSAGEWQLTIPLIISNHEKLRGVAQRFEIPYYVYPINKENKAAQEQKIITLLASFRIDLIVLARYMQILTGNLVSKYPNRIINIHHSFLPAFVGAKPYHQAYERGVKIIGATSHYVTEDLDGGPIIAQDVEHISHNDDVKDLIRKGRDLEKLVLSRAVWHHLNHQILPYKNRTIVFNH